MVQTGRIRSGEYLLDIDLTEVRRRPVEATANIRHVGLTETPDLIAVRYYFEVFEHLFHLPQPAEGTLMQLREALSFIAKLKTGEPIALPESEQLHFALLRRVNDLTGQRDGEEGSEQDQVNDVWKIWQSLEYVKVCLLTSSILILTPVARPLIQLGIELQDVLFGGQDGSLRQARLSVLAARQAGERSDPLMENLPASLNDARLTPFQRFFRVLAGAASRIDMPDDALWLKACSQSVEALVIYLETHRFSPQTLEPLKQLVEALRDELAGRKSKLLKDHSFDFRHGPKLSPRKPPHLHRDYFKQLLITAMQDFRNIRKSAKLEMDWFDHQLHLLGLYDQDGAPITVNTIRIFVKRQNVSPDVASGSLRNREMTNGVLRRGLSEVGLRKAIPGTEQDWRVSFEWQKDNRPMHISGTTTLSVQMLLQTAFLYQPRHRPKNL